MCTTHEVAEKERRWCVDNHGEKNQHESTMQQRSTEQRSTVNSKRRMTYIKILVRHSMSAVLRQSV